MLQALSSRSLSLCCHCNPSHIVYDASFLVGGVIGCGFLCEMFVLVVRCVVVSLAGLFWLALCICGLGRFDLFASLLVFSFV